MDSLYRLYLNDTMDLARSLVLKSEATATAINSQLAMLGYETHESSPHKWKYYLNLNGQYHVSDTPMTVTSIDTLETIEFTKENLAIHKATKGVYIPGTSYYEDLVKEFPHQEMLIKGIVNPVDMDEALSAKDFTILKYDITKIENNETNLIDDLQVWIFAHETRWNLKDYAISDELFPAAYLAVLFAFVPNTILNIRLDNCFTPRAHSYHIWTYLRGKGRLDRFRRSLTNKQALFLYRNIRWIMANAGKTHTFEVLVERLLTERSIPLYGFDLTHDLELMPVEIAPQVKAVRRPINTGLVGPDSKDVYELYELADKMDLLAKDNAVNKGIRVNNTEETFKSSKVNNLHTKVLESVVISESNVAEVSMDDVLALNWIQLATKNIFTANLLIPNPHSGDVLQLNPKDAYILYLYVFNHSIGATMSKIPKVGLTGILKNPRPERSVLKGIVEDRFWNEAIIDIIDGLPDVDRIINNIDFYDYCVKYYDARLTMINWFKHHSRLHGQAQIRQLSQALMHREIVELSDVELFDEWLTLKEIDLDKITKEDASQLAKNIVTAVTGVDESEALTPEVIQSDLIGILDELTSYNVCFIKTVIDSDSFKLNVNRVRIDNIKNSGANHNFVECPSELLNVSYKYPPKTEHINDGVLDSNYSAGSKSLVFGDHTLTLQPSDVRPHYTYKVPLPSLRFNERND